MAIAYLTRRISFAAAHRYRLPELSDEENTRRFGLCARPNYHGHSYACEVTVRGPIEERSGMIVDLADLDRVLERDVRSRFDHANLNLDIPEFAEGRLMPTGENLARFIFETVQRGLPAGGAMVCEVRVAEDTALSATYRGE
ncbi:MAG: 6-carboxytetrahydropterin synthase [Gemmatimonadota bacterium]|nr:6-carboxytetrahydropterin synthase [Gemmatimonadota bacterium]MDE3128184.1 6-carboxytetrahydropterin synthase [Gemmatimonadota bacterium]MDE3174104.1 6-carboxytetrahydropterin synthase [Gemmatimonadota bacterium]MDE3217027.1 6-carboxytetrahydropterin synthase [Gemmatimonadota bacterium]